MRGSASRLTIFATALRHGRRGMQTNKELDALVVWPSMGNQEEKSDCVLTLQSHLMAKTSSGCGNRTTCIATPQGMRLGHLCPHNKWCAIVIRVAWHFPARRIYHVVVVLSGSFLYSDQSMLRGHNMTSPSLFFRLPLRTQPYERVFSWWGND